MILALALTLSTAQAGGYYTADSGIVASGRGNAAVAGSKDYYAQYYNPAALMNVDAATVQGGATSVRQFLTFSRVDEDGTVQAEVANDPDVFLIPELGFATPIGKKLALAVGSVTPFTPDYLYASDGAQRYTLRSAKLRQAWIGPSVAYQITPWMAAGAGISWNFLTVQQSLAVTTSGGDNPTTDVAVDVTLKDMNNLHANAGLLFTPIDRLKIGISYLPAGKFELSGPMSLDFSEHVFYTNGIVEQAVFTDEEVTSTMVLPAITRVGVAVQAADGLEVEVDATMEAWSAMEEILIENVEITIPTSLGEQHAPESFALPAGFQDAYSLRMGVEYSALKYADLRAGALYETSAVQAPYRGVNLYDTDKIKLSGGATLKLLDNHLLIDGALSWTHFETAEFTDSVLAQTNAMGSDAAIVGNGNYAATGLTAGLGLRYRFGG